MVNRRRLALVGPIIILSVLALWPQFSASATPASQSAFYADVEGTVTDQLTGFPVARASVAVADLGLSAVAGPDGRFALQNVPVPQTTLPITLTITAPGYGEWTIQNARLVAEDTLILTAALGDAPTVIVVPPPDPHRADWPSPDELVSALADQSNLPVPLTIRVRVTGWGHCDLSRPYTVEVLDFRDYVKHVLPNEWDPAWSRESLRAGAMAAKMYAWYQIARGGKWPDADVYDSTCDQVYRPNIAYARTNAAVDDTWGWRLMRGTQLTATYYRAYFSQCQEAGLAGDCMGQWDSKAMADAGSTWQQILKYFYANTTISPAPPQFVVPQPPAPPAPPNFALRFHGNGVNDIDRVKIQIDNPITSTEPLRPLDVGAADFTVEWWMKADASENAAGAVTCGSNINWIFGNILLDRDRYNQDRKFGVSIAGGRVVFGVTGAISESLTICGATTVADGGWHHVAAARRRSDGFLWLWVDGRLDASGDGPNGDVSYPDDGVPGNYCGGPCDNSDPYVVLGAEKHDAGPGYPSFSGWLDEMRWSSTLRYTATVSFIPATRFIPDASTVALFHFDDASAPGPCTGKVVDWSGAAGGPSSGTCNHGGSPAGPEWVLSDLPPGAYRVFFPLVFK
jgi:hypothetical protein